jgi:hypothetical protein
MASSLADLIVTAVIGVLAFWAGMKSYSATSRGKALNAQTFASDWLRDLRSWASDAIDVLSDACYTCGRGDPAPSAEEKAMTQRCRARLSALIDRGRFFLPNEREQDLGDQKPEAYRGLRLPALDALVAAERVLGGDADVREFGDRKTALIAMRREFVSIVQAILEPRSTAKLVAQVLRQTDFERADDPTLGGLLPDPDSTPLGADALLHSAARRPTRPRGT